MEAGRELDALVAEKVMGCKIDRSYVEGWPNWIGGPRYRCGCGNYAHACGDDDIAEPLLNFYSTDIAAAWEVVERIKHLKDPDPMEVWIYETRSKGVTCEVYWDLGSRLAGRGQVTAATAPLAICLAALQAVQA